MLMNTGILIAVLTGAMVPACHQDTTALVAGLWNGSITLPDTNDVLDAVYDVEVKADTLMISVKIGETRFPFENIELREDTLRFTWSPGNDVLTCVLARSEDGAYEGPCTDTAGNEGRIEMKPPVQPEDANPPPRRRTAAGGVPG